VAIGFDHQTAKFLEVNDILSFLEVAFIPEPLRQGKVEESDNGINVFELHVVEHIHVIVDGFLLLFAFRGFDPAPFDRNSLGVHS